MKRLTFPLATFALATLMLWTAAENAWSQQPADDREAAPATVAETPEMWFYQQQLARYDDPKTAIRQRAAMQAAQRRQRIATMKWYGFSNARPTVNATPWGVMYSPSWTSNSRRPYAWTSANRTVVVPIEVETLRR